MSDPGERRKHMTFLERGSDLIGKTTYAKKLNSNAKYPCEYYGY